MKINTVILQGLKLRYFTIAANIIPKYFKIMNILHITLLHNCFCYLLIISYNKYNLRQSSIKVFDTYMTEHFKIKNEIAWINIVYFIVLFLVLRILNECNMLISNIHQSILNTNQIKIYKSRK